MTVKCRQCNRTYRDGDYCSNCGGETVPYEETLDWPITYNLEVRSHPGEDHLGMLSRGHPAREAVRDFARTREFTVRLRVYEDGELELIEFTERRRSQ